MFDSTTNQESTLSLKTQTMGSGYKQQPANVSGVAKDDHPLLQGE